MPRLVIIRLRQAELARGEVDHDAEAVEVGRDAGERDQRLVTPIGERALEGGPAEEEVRDGAHALPSKPRTSEARAWPACIRSEKSEPDRMSCTPILMWR